MPRNVTFYTTETGKRPVEHFLDSLESKAQRTDARQIKLAENYRRDYFTRNRRAS